MKKIKVSEATGTTLDWLVATCEGHKPVFTSHWVTPVSKDTPRRVCVLMPSWAQPYEPSRNWAVGGPIIEREGGTLWSTNADGWRYKACYDFANDKEGAVMHGPTPLIAAMRCFCYGRLGDIVDVPEELT